jgi:hypothetical protein
VQGAARAMKRRTILKIRKLPKEENGPLTAGRQTRASETVHFARGARAVQR